MLEIVEGEAIGRLWVRLGLCVSNEPLYVLGAGQHGLVGRDNSRG